MRRLLFSLSLLFAAGCADPDPTKAALPAAARVLVSPELAGENCAAGGQRIDVGVDRDGDGILSPAEIEETTYICHGEHGADGKDGAGGRDGEDGRDGADGMDGEDGQTPLVVVTPEPPGENCAEGGQRIDVGFDDDGDGALGEEEIDETAYVCHGEDGEDGRTALISTTPEPPGPNCPVGGQRIETGYDENGDGLLTGEEIGRTVYVCDGEPGEDGRPPMVVTTPEAPGPNCAAGGQRVDMGVDTDQDGALSEGEIERTVYVCHGVDGADGLAGRTPLVSTTAEPPGANCAAGGQRVDVGYDDDGDGALEGAEIGQTVYICSGVDGQDGDDVPPCAIETDLSIPASTLSCPDGTRLVWKLGEVPPAITGGQGHSCALRTNGEVVCWGTDVNGQSTPPAHHPLAIPFTAVSTYRRHGCALRYDQRVECWGDSGGTMRMPTETQFKAISVGDSVSCGIKTEDDQLTCWGFRPSVGFHPPGGTYKAVAMGETRAGSTVGCAIRTTGTITCWGSQNAGQILDNIPAGDDFEDLTIGRGVACAHKTDGELECWGSWSLQGPGGVMPTPPGPFRLVRSGNSSICGIRVDDTGICWDRYYNFPLPDEPLFDIGEPGMFHVCGIKKNGGLFCVGDDNSAGQISPLPDFY